MCSVQYRHPRAFVKKVSLSAQESPSLFIALVYHCSLCCKSDNVIDGNGYFWSSFLCPPYMYLAMAEKSTPSLTFDASSMTTMQECSNVVDRLPAVACCRATWGSALRHGRSGITFGLAEVDPTLCSINCNKSNPKVVTLSLQN